MLENVSNDSSAALSINGQWKSMVPHRATWGLTHFLCQNGSIRQWAEMTTHFIQEAIGKLSGWKSFWCFPMFVNFSISKQHCAVSKITYSTLWLHTFIDNSFIRSLCSPQPLIVCVHDLSFNGFHFSSLSCLHVRSLGSKFSSLWAFIDISPLTFSLTLTIMCAALSDAQVVWSFIRAYSLLFSFPLGYSFLLPVLWKSSLPLQNPCGLIWETLWPHNHCSG